jgi:hypothetical protein
MGAPAETISTYDPSLWESIKEAYRLGVGPESVNPQELPTAPLKDWVDRNVPLGNYVSGLIPDTKAGALVQAATALIPTPARSASAQAKALEATRGVGPRIARTGEQVLEDWFGMHPSYPKRIENILGKKAQIPTAPGPLKKPVMGRPAPSVPLDSDFVTKPTRIPHGNPYSKAQRTAAQTASDTVGQWDPYGSPNLETPWIEHLPKALMGAMLDLGIRFARKSEPEAEAAQRWAEGRGSSGEQATALESGGSDQTVGGEQHDPTYGSWKNKTADVSKMTPDELSAYVASLGGQ